MFSVRTRGGVNICSGNKRFRNGHSLVDGPKFDDRYLVRSQCPPAADINTCLTSGNDRTTRLNASSPFTAVWVNSSNDSRLLSTAWSSIQQQYE